MNLGYTNKHDTINTSLACLIYKLARKMIILEQFNGNVKRKKYSTGTGIRTNKVTNPFGDPAEIFALVCTLM